MELLKIPDISRQAYYKWLNRDNSENDQLNKLLMQKISDLHEKHRHTLGSRKMTMHLNNDPKITRKINRKRVLRLMRIMGIKTTIRKQKRYHIKSQKEYAAENLLNQQFIVDEPNQVWASDFTQVTYGIHQEFTAKVSIVLDLHGGFVLSHNISATETTAAAIQVFQRAFVREGNVHPMIHTDRGSSYMAKEFDRFMLDHKATRSMSRPGKPYDNAIVERWWNEFKLNWIEYNVKPTTYKELVQFVEDAVRYFNYESRSSKRNGLTPVEYRSKTVSIGREA